LGVILIVRPPIIFGSEDDSAAGTGSTMSHSTAGFYALLSAVAFSLYQIGVRASRTESDPFVTTFYTNANTILWFGLYFTFIGEYKTLTLFEYFGCFVFGVICLAGFVLISYALKYATPSIVGLLGYTQLVFSLIVDICIFADFPSSLTLAGATLIVGSCLYLVLKQKPGSS